MENLPEIYDKVFEKFKIEYTHDIIDEFWKTLSQQPSHIQYRIINQALSKYPRPKVCEHQNCPEDRCIEKSKVPVNNTPHVQPPMVPRKKNIFNFIFRK